MTTAREDSCCCLFRFPLWSGLYPPPPPFPGGGGGGGARLCPPHYYLMKVPPTTCLPGFENLTASLISIIKWQIWIGINYLGAVHKLCRLNRWGKGDYFLKDLLKWKRRHMGEGDQNCLFWEHSLWTAPCSTVPLLSTDGWRESRCELFLFLFAVSQKK